MWGHFLLKKNAEGVWEHAAHNVWAAKELHATPQGTPFAHALSDENDDRLYFITQRACETFSRRYVRAVMKASIEGKSPPFVRLVDGQGITFDGEICLVLKPYIFDGLMYLDLPGEEPGEGA